MRATSLVLLACAALAAADVITVFPEGVIQQGDVEPVFVQDQQEPETVFRVDQDLDGSLRVTGMMQSFRLDASGANSINQLLSRPSFLDLSWSSWVDQRMEVLDMFQNLMSPVPRCPHMGPEAGALDTSMVSYLASSRFGPAILTTYAQKFQDDVEDDFDYEEVYIPEGESFGKSYEDASLLEDLSADADKAFQREDESRLLSQQGLGFFGANLRGPQGQGEPSFEAAQSSLRVDPLRFQTYDQYVTEQPDPDTDFFEDSAPMDVHQVVGFALFLLLCFGCVYVWISLLCSCCRLGKEVRAKRRAEKAALQKAAQQELLAPLMPEGLTRDVADVEIAASHAPSGTYYAPRGTEYVTIAVPLVNGQPKM